MHRPMKYDTKPRGGGDTKREVWSRTGPGSMLFCPFLGAFVLFATLHAKKCRGLSIRTTLMKLEMYFNQVGPYFNQVGT